MSAAQIGGVLVGRRKRRGDPDVPTDPVRKHSYDVEDRRAQPWRRIGTGTLPFGKAFVKALNQTARWLFDQQRREGHQGSDRLQRSHLLVLEGMLRKLDFASGRLDPTWDTIAADGSCGRTTVDGALEAFHHAGLISSVRRTVRREGMEGQQGPQLRQTSDAFFFDCKARMAPDTFARFWSFLLEELAKCGRWLKSKARAVLNSFNSEAVPSPREQKVHRLMKRVARAGRSTPDEPPPLRRSPVETRPAVPSSKAESAPSHRAERLEPNLGAALAKLAATLGLDPDAELRASP